MIELTEKQTEELSLAEPRAVDPKTHSTYVLVPEELYQRMKGLLYEAGEWDDQVLRTQLARSSGENGWDEPIMSDYDRYDEARSQSCQ